MDEKEKEAVALLKTELATLRMYRGGDEPTRALEAVALLAEGIERRDKALVEVVHGN